MACEGQHDDEQDKRQVFTLSQETRTRLAQRFSATMEILDGESDRGAAIVGGALIEVAVDGALKKYLIPPYSKEDEFLDRDFSVALKIDLAHRVGLIRPKERRLLHQIRRIRNDFAHDPNSQRFDDSTIRDRVVNMCELSSDFLAVVVKGLREAAPLLGEMASPHAFVESVGARLAFQTVVALHCAGLEFLYGEIEPLQPLP
jgi:hypothetical protein